MTNTGSDFTIESVLAELRDIALAARDVNGGIDYVYTNPMADSSSSICLYVHGDEPGCLIGRWLHSKGVSLTDLARFENMPALSIIPRFFPMVERSVIFVLDAVQSRQDDGSPWLYIVDDTASERV